LVEILRTETCSDDASHSVDDLGASAVVECDVEQHSAVVGCLANAQLELALDIRGEFVDASDGSESDVVLEQRAELEAEIPLEEHHQRVDLGPRALPVFYRKGVERQNVDAKTRR